MNNDLKTTFNDLHLLAQILDAIQTFQDNQIRCRDMSNNIMALREPQNARAINYLEKIVGEGNVNNKTLRKVLNAMHPFILKVAKQGLGAAEELDRA